MIAEIGWVANGFRQQTRMSFSFFKHRWPNAFPAYFRGKLCWIENGGGSEQNVKGSLTSLTTWTCFESNGEPEDGVEALLEQIAIAQHGKLCVYSE